MPEGDTIRRLAARLHPLAAGRRILRSVFRHNRWATTDLAGLEVLEVQSAGKHLLMRLGRDGQHQVTVHSHLRMHGRWSVGVPPRTPEWRRRVELWLDGAPPLVGIDLPVLDVGPAAAESTWIGHLGPDLCAATFDVDEAVRRLSGQPERPLGGALLDQRNLAGIGNLYAVEIPFLCGLSPWTPIGDVDRLDVPVLVGRALLPVNALEGPQTTTGMVGRAREHWIYGRRGQACPVCRTSLRVADEPDVPWGRVTTWCDDCQGAVADGRRARHLLRRHRLALQRLAEEVAERQHRSS